MDIQSLVNEFGGSKPSASIASDGLDVRALANEFGGVPTNTVERKDGVTVVKPIRNVDELEASRPKAAPPDTRSLGKKFADFDVATTKAVEENVAEKFHSSKKMFNEGVNALPTAAGFLKTLGGGLGMAGSVISGPVEELVTKPAKYLSGNEEFGNKLGTITELAIPIPGTGGAGAASTTARAVSAVRPRNRALQDVIATIEPQNIPKVLDELKSNPRLSLMDVSPAVGDMAQKLVTREGKHFNYLKNVVEDRMSSAKGVVGDIYDDALGIPVNVLERMQKFKDDAAKVGTEQIQPALASAKPVDLSEAIGNIKNVIEPGLTNILKPGEGLAIGDVPQKLKDLLKYITDGKVQLTDANRIHSLQAALRADAETLMFRGGQDALVGKAMMNMRNDLVSALDKASGGKYKPALKAYRDEKEIEEAFSTGASIISNSKKFENRPEFFEAWKKGATAEEIEAAKEGARIAVDTEIRTAKNAARKGTDIVMPDFSTTKLKTLFGEEEAGRMIKLLQDETKIARQNSKMFDNSQTAMRNATNSRLDAGIVKQHASLESQVLPVMAEMGAIAAAGSPVYGAGYLAAKGSNAIKDVTARKLAQERNFQIAKMVSASDGPLRENLIRQLEAVAYPAPRSIASTANALSRVVGP